MFFVKQDITGHGDGSLYLRRFRIGRLALHIFYRGDDDKDCHDHPHDFWTFPLTSYVEEVLEPSVVQQLHRDRERLDKTIIPPSSKTRIVQVVRAFRITKREATHTHRVLGRWNGYSVSPNGYEYRGLPFSAKHTPGVSRGKIVTIVWRSRKKRSWGFVKNRGNLWCWEKWRAYRAGGRNNGCE